MKIVAFAFVSQVDSSIDVLPAEAAMGTAGDGSELPEDDAEMLCSTHWPTLGLLKGLILH